MALHDKNSIRHRLEDEVYASSDLSVSAPKYRFPKSEHDPRHAYAVVHDGLMLDGNSRQNLATFCQTWAEPEVHALMNECIDKNMMDKDEYPQTAEIEARCVHMLADLVELPRRDRIHDRLFDHRLQRSGDAGRHGHEAPLGSQAKGSRFTDGQAEPDHRPGPNLLAQVRRAIGMSNMREIPMEDGRLIMTPEEVIKRCDENTIGVVPTLGVTFTCQFEPVQAVAGALDAY